MPRRAAALLALCILTLSAQPAAKWKAGHSHIAEGLNEGPRQKPWEIAGTGRVSFPITHKNPETQKWFNHGVALLHSFWYFEAERSFRWCLKLEPDNAMAWWGLARAQAGGKRTVEFVKEAVKRKDTVTGRERMYIEADAASYIAPVGEKPDRADTRLALERLVMKYPDDIEAKAFLALETMGENRMAAELLVREILAKQPDHPGAHHYRIHNWDGKDPEYALPSCARYGEVAPGIGHAMHMPGHIYAGAGMWHEAAISMDAATRIEKKYMYDRQALPLDTWNYVHNANYLAYIQAQLGMEKLAVDAGRQLLRAPRLAAGNRRSKLFPPHMEAQILLLRTYARFGRWKELLEEERFEWDKDALGNQVQKLHITALAQLGLGNLDAARKAFDELDSLAGKVKEADDYFLKSWHPVMLREVKAKILLAQGRTLDGLTELGEAASAWARMLPEQNDPAYYPTQLYDDLGRAYLDAKSPALAVKAFERSLELVRNNAWALSGLAEAHVALGDRTTATRYYSRLLHVWADADAPLPAAKLGLTATPKDESPGPQRNYRKITLSQFGPEQWEPYPAPELRAIDPQRKTATLAEYKGRNVVLIFYLGSECAHCLEQLQKAAEKKQDFEKRNTVVLAISPNKPEDNADSETIKPMPFRVLSDTSLENARRFLSFDDFENLELHSTILVDAQGKIRWAHRGGDPFNDFDGLFREIDRVNRESDYKK